VLRLERRRHAACEQWVRDHLGWIARLAHHDGDRSRRVVEEHAAHRGRDDDPGVLAVVGVLPWRQVDAHRETEPAARSAAGGHQHQRLAGVETEHRRYRGHELGLVADAECAAAVDGVGVDGELFGGRRHAARMRRVGRVMGALLRSAVGNVR
jgi:hypothetical protein